jgi:hypothetical protein
MSADTHSDKRALSHIDISNNNIRQEGTQALAEALKGNVTVTELIVSSNNMTYDAKGDPGKMAGVIALADAIPGMGALTELTFGDTQLVTMSTEMTEAIFSRKLRSYEARIVAAFLPKCT